MNYYVYLYIDPRTLKPFYVGKGKGSRIYSHLNETIYTTINLRKFNRISEIRQDNLEPIVEVFKNNLTNEQACEIEISLIQKYGRIGYDNNGILLNHSKGGRGGQTRINFKHTQQTKNKIREKCLKSNKWKGKNNPNYGKNLKGKNNPNFGKRRTEESKQLQSNKMKNRYCGKNNPMYGTSWTDERRNKMIKKLSHKWIIWKNNEEFYVGNLKYFCTCYKLNHSTAYWCYRNGREYCGYKFCK